jgi:hypothetical protein
VATDAPGRSRNRLKYTSLRSCAPVAAARVKASAIARELGVFVFHHSGSRLAPDWAVVGLRPTLKGFPAGRLPRGAVVGRNSVGRIDYSVCPPKGHKMEYGVFVYAFSRLLWARTGFNPTALLNRVGNAVVGQGLTALRAGGEPAVHGA